MKFIDPLSIKCTHCGYEGFYPVNALLNLRAKCNKCKSPLDDHGIVMREFMDETSVSSCKVLISLSIEEEFEITISDDDLDLEKFIIVNDFIDFVSEKVVNISKDEIRIRVIRIIKDEGNISDEISPDTDLKELFKNKDFENCYKRSI